MKLSTPGLSGLVGDFDWFAVPIRPSNMLGELGGILSIGDAGGLLLWLGLGIDETATSVATSRESWR